ncbi:MAG: GTP-binding protein [Planctomycetes bacterium]|nr:GTP-binding protein [Planctomycetota bacterium]MCB9909223.1 GTP-binding protein [Planctomycetota bacterium]MCB9913295.1 GTP-binding protein [Planctomycetota bacterium]
MIRKKVCLLGSFAVGKTSLVRRFLHSEFSDRYQTTVGVKVDKKELEIDGQAITLVIWDLYGEDRWQEVRGSYLRGASGGFLVADATRLETLDVVRGLAQRLREQDPDIHLQVVVNKVDLRDGLAIPLAEWRARIDWAPLTFTSAKTGEGVEQAFDALARACLSPR